MAVVSNGTTIIDNGAFDPAITTGSLVLIKSITASSSASISFVDGTDGVVLDGTYSSYVFKFINIKSQNYGVNFEFNLSTDSGSNYNVVKTTTSFYGYHTEDDAQTGLAYDNNLDLAQSTNFQLLFQGLRPDGNRNGSGTLQIFNFNSNTYVKHFIYRGMRNSYSEPRNYAVDFFVAGYGNTTSAINAIKFQFNSGNIDDGIIKLYGVK